MKMRSREKMAAELLEEARSSRSRSASESDTRVKHFMLPYFWRVSQRRLIRDTVILALFIVLIWKIANKLRDQQEVTPELEQPLGDIITNADEDKVDNLELYAQIAADTCPKLSDDLVILCDKYGCDTPGAECDNGFMCCPTSQCNVCINLRSPCRKSVTCDHPEKMECVATPVMRCDQPPCRLNIRCLEREAEPAEDDEEG